MSMKRLYFTTFSVCVLVFQAMGEILIRDIFDNTINDRKYVKVVQGFIVNKMKEKEVIETIAEFISKQFPRNCPSCGRQFNTHADFIKNTTYVDKPVSYDAENDDWQPEKPLGTMAISNCSCGTSLALYSQGMNKATLWNLMNWAKKKAQEKEITISDVLEEIRKKIGQHVLQNEKKAEKDTEDV